MSDRKDYLVRYGAGPGPTVAVYGNPEAGGVLVVEGGGASVELMAGPAGRLLCWAAIFGGALAGRSASSPEDGELPLAVRVELARQGGMGFGPDRDAAHTPLDWYRAVAGDWNSPAGCRRLAELKCAAEAGATARVDHVMAEFGAVAVAYFRAKAARP